IARSRRGATTTTGLLERPLLTKDEIYNMPIGKALLHIGGLHPIWVKQVSSYKSRAFKSKRGLPVEAYQPTTEPLIAPSYRDLDLPVSDSIPPPSPLPPTALGPHVGGEIIGW
ncbi:MAG TPA: type IV secretory system conjugative DNA transfer family protein, partial [Candidatus Manganitrophaceae bacterium]|nr:type IV secretory system conjugative DNA transfer family protein [Candidatus Manganitrophaceae bacterium]